MKKHVLILAWFAAAAFLLSSCASKEAVKIKIHTDPEGSHIVYRVADDYRSDDPPWIYLGVTPYQGVTQINSSSFEQADTITFKVMRHGYLDQVKKWSGDQFQEEYEREGMMFWAPRLIKAGQ
ncbi:MAG: hypothetical protein P8X86_00595 [Desulfofustis sp.]|jgi:hypothetical protein